MAAAASERLRVATVGWTMFRMFALRPRRADRRLLAAVSALWIVIGVVLGARHEALVAHHVDPHTGASLHVAGIVGAHTGDRSDVHRSHGSDDVGGCEIIAALHAQMRVATTGSPAVLALAAVTSTTFAPATAPVSTRILHFAPKTSPPNA